MPKTLINSETIEWLDVPKSCLAHMSTYQGGLVPCVITYLRRVTYSDGRVEHWADAKFTATRGPWKRGDTECRDLSSFVPRSAVHKSRQRPGFFAIWAFNWSDFIPSLKV